MAKVSAEQFSMEGDKYLGRSYDEMDCQEFYERCAADAGLKMDLKGSNAWYREFLKNGWVGTPEGCKAVFGSIPKGATLMIHAYDGGEEKRGYHDGLGNARHIGIKTGRGKGAIHSSASRGCVAESDFHDKTIRNGGWNTVALYPKFTYGEKIDRILEDVCGQSAQNHDQHNMQEDEVMYTAILAGGNVTKPINIRKAPEGDLLEKLPQGSKVEVIGESGNWCRIQYTKNGKTYTGYVDGNFVTVAGVDEDLPVADDSQIPAEDFDDDDDDDWGNETVSITLSMTAREAATALPVLQKLVDAIVDKVGRG